MSKISNEAELKAMIRELELKTTLQENLLKENARSIVKSFQPANLLKIGLQNVKAVAVNRDVRSTVLNTFVGLAAGYVTRRFVVGKNSNIFKRTLGTAVQAAITKIVFKKLTGWQEKTSDLLSDLADKRRAKRLL